MGHSKPLAPAESNRTSDGQIVRVVDSAVQGAAAGNPPARDRMRTRRATEAKQTHKLLQMRTSPPFLGRFALALLMPLLLACAAPDQPTAVPSSPGAGRRRGSLLHRTRLTGTTCAGPGPDQSLAAVADGDTPIVPKLDWLARSVPDVRTIRRSASGTRRETGPGPDALQPGRSAGKDVLQYPRHLRRV